MPNFARPFNAFKTAGADGVAVSGTDTVRGAKTRIHGQPSCSYQLFWTGTPGGTFSIQVSNKPEPNDANDDDWTTLTLATAISQPAGAGVGNDFVGLADLEAEWVRPKYLNSSSSGTIHAWFVSKGM